MMRSNAAYALRYPERSDMDIPTAEAILAGRDLPDSLRPPMTSNVAKAMARVSELRAGQTDPLLGRAVVPR